MTDEHETEQLQWVFAHVDEWTLGHMRAWIRTQTHDEDEAAALEGLMLAELAEHDPGPELDYVLDLGWPEVARRCGTSWHRH